MNVLLGVTGCIAAYKACEIVRAFQKVDVDVTVMMTEAATRFVSPHTFEALSGHPVGISLFDNPIDPIAHIRLAENCDALLIAPCTANALAKVAHGIADDLLTSAALACTAPCFVSPAMNVHMYENPATQANIALLKERGVHVLDPESGYLACGDIGVGKLPEPQHIVNAVLQLAYQSQSDLIGRHVLITSGPTVEPIDTVRFISNRSSGKMGSALATAALNAGAQVTVVSGPVAISYPNGASVVAVDTAEQMLAAVQDVAEDADIIICAAAVADYRPIELLSHKLKKGFDDDALSTIHLCKNPDILKYIADTRRPDQVLIGFAAETDNVIAYAKDKLQRKDVDMIVANEVGVNKVFGCDDDKAAFVTQQEIEELPLMSKTQLADLIIAKAVELSKE